MTFTNLLAVGVAILPLMVVQSGVATGREARVPHYAGAFSYPCCQPVLKRVKWYDAYGVRRASYLRVFDRRCPLPHPTYGFQNAEGYGTTYYQWYGYDWR